MGGRTMVVETGYPVEPAPVAKPEGRSFRKSIFRPKSLSLAPLDPRELSRKLSAAKREKEEERSPRSARSWSEKSPVSPLWSAKSKSSPSSSRRGSLFNLSIKSANWDPKKDGDDAVPTTPYRHVPKNAAAQFTKTTTVEHLTEKPLIPKEALPALASLPSPEWPDKATISLQEYNRLYRRTQSLCSGRPNERSNCLYPPTLESMAEDDEETVPSKGRYSLQTHHMKAFNFGREITRRRSTDNLEAEKAKGCDAEEPSEPRRNSFDQQRKASASSIATDGNSSFMHEFDLSRRGSEATSGPSRRGSLIPRDATAMNMYRVDWSQNKKDENPESRCKVIDIPKSKGEKSPVQSPVCGDSESQEVASKENDAFKKECVGGQQKVDEED